MNVSPMEQGEAVGDLRHGRGTQTCSNGDTYRGAWRYDKREGTGVADFARGAQYDGEWKDDKAHGCRCTVQPPSSNPG